MMGSKYTLSEMQEIVRVARDRYYNLCRILFHFCTTSFVAFMIHAP